MPISQRPGLALIFDLDGTLADTSPDLLAATNAVLAAQERPELDLAHLRQMVGFGARALIHQAMAASGRPVSDQEIPALLKVFLTHYSAHLADGTRLFPQVAETLQRLKHEGARLGVLTNKPQELTDPLLESLGLKELFAAVFGAGRKTYTKPDPRIFHDVVTACGGGPAVMVGDSVTDLNTARAAGVPCILMSYGFTPVPVSELGADAVLDDFSQIPEALQQLGLV